MTEDEMVGWLTDSTDMSLSKLCKLVMDGEAWCAAVGYVFQGFREDGISRPCQCLYLK